MSELTNDFDVKQELAKVSEVVTAGAARTGGKGRKLKPEDQRQIVRSLGEILIRSGLPLAEIDKELPKVSSRLYADALSETWGKLTSERREDAIHWVEGLPKSDANSIRRSLIPSIAAQDPRSGRLMLPTKPKVLDSAEERERFAKDWLDQDLGPFGSLLGGELAEHEVTRVLSWCCVLLANWG